MQSMCEEHAPLQGLCGTNEDRACKALIGPLCETTNSDTGNGTYWTCLRAGEIACSRLMNRTWTQVGFVTSCILATQVILVLIGRSLPYSTYYCINADLRAKRLFRFHSTSLQALSDLRAWKLARKSMDGPLFYHKQTEPPRLCVAVQSYPSGMERELEVTIGALLSRTPLGWADQVRIFVINAAHPSNLHREAESLGDLVTVKPIVRPVHLPFPKTLVRAPPQAQDCLDYAAALRMLHSEGCLYGLLLQDGAIPTEGWLSRLFEALGTAKGPTTDPPWVMLRLMAEYSQFTYSWLEVEPLVVVFAMAAVLTVLVWGVSSLVLRAGPFVKVHEAVFHLHPIAMLALLVNFSIALLLLGRPNMPPLGPSTLIPIDTHQRSPIANLYPRDRLLDYAQLLEQQVVRSLAHPPPHRIIPPGQLHEQLKRQLERVRGRHYELAVINGSIFQDASKHQTGSVSDLKMSMDFRDDDKPIRFDPIEFLERNHRQFY